NSCAIEVTPRSAPLSFHLQLTNLPGLWSESCPCTRLGGVGARRRALIRRGIEMGNVVQLYTSLNGRIGRRTWWLASIAMGVVILIIEFAILAPLGFSPMANLGAMQAGDAA